MKTTAPLVAVLLLASCSKGYSTAPTDPGTQRTADPQPAAAEQPTQAIASRRFVGPCTPAVLAARLFKPEQCPPALDEIGVVTPCRESVTWQGKTAYTEYNIDLDKREVTATNHWDDREPRVSGLTRYDQVGNVVEYTSFRNDNSIASRVQYTYDAQGRLVQRLVGGSAGGPKDERYTYDANGVLVGIQVSVDPDAASKTESQGEFRYDSAGRLLRSTMGTGERRTAVELEYDAQGRTITEKKTSASSNDFVDRFDYEDGLLRVKRKYMDGEQMVRTDYNYDKRGLLSTEVSTGESNGTERYEYDNRGRQMSRRTFDSDGQPDGVLEYTYRCPSPAGK